MRNKRYKTSFIVILITGFTSLALAGVPVGNLDVFNTDFDNKTPLSFLGTGGAQLGEPSDLSALTAQVIEGTPGENFVRVEYDPASTSGRSLRWDFLDGGEITEGIATISFQFTPSTLDRYSIGIREGGGSSRLFLALTYTTGGTISGTDAVGVIPMVNNTFAAGITQNIRMIFDIDADTSELIINGSTVFSGRLHGITDRGVGRLLTGYASSSNSTSFTLDNMSVKGPVELPLVLDANFEDKILMQTIDTGGAAVGEPATISNGLITEIIQDGMNNQALLLENSTAGSARAMRWEFIDNLEIHTGIVAIEIDIEFNELDNYQILVRENSGSSSSFTTTRFLANGNITVSDSNGTAGIVGTYQANQRHRLRFTFDVDNETYTALLDDDILVKDRPHGVNNGNGIGSVLVAFQSTAATNAFFIIDDFQVGSSIVFSKNIFTNSFE